MAAVLLLSQHRTTMGWPATLGTVERLVIVPTGDPNDSRAPGERFQPQVTYRYEVDGEYYEAEKISVFDWVYRNEERARLYLERFDIRAGERIPVYFNPETPEEAVIVRDIPWGRLEVILAVVVLIGLPVAVVAFSLFDLVRGGASRRDDQSRGRFW